MKNKKEQNRLEDESWLDTRSVSALAASASEMLGCKRRKLRL
jgi:hypothetical protein